MEFLGQRAAVIGGVRCESENEQSAGAENDSSRGGELAWRFIGFLRFKKLDVAIAIGESQK
jgi:hypothetical protein